MMRTLTDSARKTVSDKVLFKQWIQFIDNQVMYRLRLKPRTARTRLLLFLLLLFWLPLLKFWFHALLLLFSDDDQ